MADFLTESIVFPDSNTGTEGRELIIKKVVQLLFVPTSHEFTVADMEDAEATLESLVWNDSPASRGYFLPFQVVDVVDESGASKEVTFSDDTNVTLYHGKQKYNFVLDTVDSRAVEILQRYSHRQGSFKVYIGDIDGVLHGTASGSNKKGFALSNIYASSIKWHGGDPGDAPKAMLSLTFANANEMNSGNLRSSRTGLDFNAIPKMNTLTLSQATAPNGSRIVDILVKSGNTNFADGQYAAALTQTGAWKATVTVGGATIAVSTVTTATVGGNTVYRLTLASTNYPTNPATFRLTLHLPSVLAALTTPLEGFEVASSGALTLTPA